MNVPLRKEEHIKILNSQDLYGIMQRILLREDKIDQDREHLWVASLAHNNLLLSIEHVSKGSVNKTIAMPMEVFSLPLQKRAVRVILVHNHPSGDLRPSERDKDVTNRMIQVGVIVDTEVVDHLIITPTSYVSFEDLGLMEKLRWSSKYKISTMLEHQYKREAERIRAERDKRVKQGFREGRKEGKEEGLRKGKELGIKTGREEGLKEGMEKGKEEGLKEGKLETAKRMKETGMAIETIMELTGLSRAVIARIRA